MDSTNTATSEKKGIILQSTFLVKRYDISHIPEEGNHSMEEVSYASSTEGTYPSDFFESTDNMNNMKRT